MQLFFSKVRAGAKRRLILWPISVKIWFSRPKQTNSSLSRNCGNDGDEGDSWTIFFLWVTTPKNHGSLDLVTAGTLLYADDTTFIQNKEPTELEQETNNKLQEAEN